MMRKEDLEVGNEEQVTSTNEQCRNILHDTTGGLQSVDATDGENLGLFGARKADRQQGNGDVPLLSEQEKRELVSLVRDRNISMDFILEMKEAFLIFDKVLIIVTLAGMSF